MPETIVTAPGKGVKLSTSFHGTERSEVFLQYLPQPDFLEFSLPNTHIALITNEGSDLTPTLAKTLEAQGNKVVVLNLEKNTSSNHTNTVQLESISDQAIATALSQIETQYGKVGTFIHLHPH